MITAFAEPSNVNPSMPKNLRPLDQHQYSILVGALIVVMGTIGNKILLCVLFYVSLVLIGWESI